MYLIATNSRDITCDFVVRELKRRKHPFYRFNTENASQGTFEFRPLCGEWTFSDLPGSFRLSDVRAAYYRRPALPVSPARLNEAEAEYVTSEWSAVLRSLWNLLDGRWLNSPFAIERAEDKLTQLQIAAQLGFSIPLTVVTNDVSQVREFVREAPTIAKPLRQALLDVGPKGAVIFTSRIPDITPELTAGFHLAPSIFQREIPKRHDVRVTVVGSKTFAVAIDSQSTAASSVDWRRGSDPELAHNPIDLPIAIHQKCIKLVETMKLSFGAIDLIEDVDGNFWFLEVNPNGQWAWIENRTGLPISAAIVDRMEVIACG